jgi:hypothetical protein
MTRLERRYRLLLRLLPGWYRERRGDEMVETFLDERGELGDLGDLRDEYGSPPAGEVLAVVLLALRTRIGGLGAPPKARRVGDTVRRVAVALIAFHAVTAVAALLTVAVLALGGTAAARELGMMLLAPRTGQEWWQVAEMALRLLWVPALIALLTEQRRTARGLAVLAALEPVCSLVAQTVDGSAGAFTLLPSALSAAVAAGATAVGFRADTPAPPQAWRRGVLLGAVGIAAGYAAVTALGAGLGVWVSPEAVTVLLAGIAVGLAARLRPGRLHPAWPTVVVVTAVLPILTGVVDLVGGALTGIIVFTSLYSALSIGVAVVAAVVVLVGRRGVAPGSAALEAAASRSGR